MLCRKKEHSQLRAPWIELKKQLESYFGNFPSSIEDNEIEISANFLFQVHAAAPYQSDLWCSSDTDPELGVEDSTPTIDSSTGNRVQVGSEFIIPESKEHSFYMMQELMIGETSCLVFFDSGANTHLLDGSLAVSQKLQVTSSKPKRISVVGGTQIRTQYGSYRFNLGPTESGEFIELNCLGMDNVSGKFQEYDLTDICKEYIEEDGEDVALPRKVGGTKVHLLLGIKNTNLCPVLIKTLNSGVGVYRSPFKDRFGSRIIFAGPHASFTRGNTSWKAEVSMAVMDIKDSQLAIDESHENGTEQIDYAITLSKSLGITVHPHPINEEDVRDAGCEVPVQLEDIIDEYGGIDVIEGNEGHFCSVMKAFIPISRMRELIDQDDLDDKVPWKCSSCSKCVTCKMSRRRTAVSLQESAEQEIIEKSVTVDLEKGKVYVKLPFKTDPVEFLTKKHGGPSNEHQALKVYKSQCKKSLEIKEGVRQVYAELVKARELVAAREKRWKELCDARDWNNMVIRGGWRQALSNLPSWKPKTRRGKKRPRSSCVLQSIRNQPMRESVGNEPAPGPSKEGLHAGEMRGSGAKDSGDEVLLCDEDEGAAAPQRSKRKKKQGGSAGILRTYDEMIKAEKMLFSDEYELELFDNSDKL